MGGAKNCPETPRQKMIGMMYLILTAMLALNVSADILNGFTKLRHSMESSINSSEVRTADVMEMFSVAYNKDEASKKKYGEWYIAAQNIQAESDRFYNYIENFKLDIANMVDGAQYDKMPDKLKGGSDTNKPHQYAITETDPETGLSRAETFKQKMNAYCDYMTTPTSECVLKRMDDPKFRHAWEQKEEMFKSLFSTDDVENEESETIAWELSTFSEMPADAVIAMLTKYQNDVRMAENDLIAFIYAQTGESDFVVNQVTPIVIPTNGEYIMAGQRYRAKIASAMIDTNQVPRVFINGQEIFDGVYEVAASGVGPKSYTGYMLIGDDTTHYQFQGQYTVGAPSATISNTDLNIMYRGYDNPFSVSVPGVSADKIRVQCAGASVTKNGNLWIIKPSSGATAVIEVLAEVDGRMVSMGKQEYRVKQLPRPDAYFMLGGEAKGETGKITRADLINSNARIEASYGPDGLIQAKFKITGFAVKLPSGTEIQNQGDKFNGKTLDAIKKLKAGNMVTIRYIKAVGPDGATVTLRALPLELN